MFLVISALFSCFASCNDENNGDGDTNISDNSNYAIVYSENASANIVKAVCALRDRVKARTNIELAVKDDIDEAPMEILIGDTDRDATASVKAKLDGVNNKSAFVIEAVGNKIVILGKSDDVTVHAIKYFATSFISDAGKDSAITIDPNHSSVHKADTDMIVFPENLVGLKFSDKISVYSHDDKFSAQSLYYPTAIQLRYQENAENNGKMLATLNSSEQFYRILESKDGTDWKQIATVYDRVNSLCRGGRMPMLYELPADMGQYKKGTVLLAGTSSALNTSSQEKSAIVVYYSTDLGKTWTSGQNVDFGEGRTDGEGVWEPCLIYEESTGRIYCFYSDDSDPAHDQKIVYKYTSDLVTWTGSDGNGADSAPFDAVASADSKLRPGMVSLTKMDNGEYIMVYEVGHARYKDSTATVYYKKSKSLGDWGDVSYVGDVVLTTDKHAFGSAPWCTYTSVAGENGMFITTGRYRDDRNSDPSEPDLFISFDFAESFTHIENPFDYTNTDLHLGKFGYSPFFLTSSDGKTIYYFNTSLFKPVNKTQCIEMVRIEIIE